MGVFRKTEVQHLLLAWLVLGFCFSAGSVFSPSTFPLTFGVALVTVGLGFIFHELTHKFTAQKYGCLAEFRLWVWGLVLALMVAVMSGGRFIFAAPGAVYIAPLARPVGGGWGFEISRRQHAFISLSGPIANVVLAMVFLILSGFGGIFGVIGRVGYQVNLWLAAFNMLPFGPLDGQKVLAWNPAVWAGVTVPLWVLTFLLSML